MIVQIMIISHIGIHIYIMNRHYFYVIKIMNLMGPLFDGTMRRFHECAYNGLSHPYEGGCLLKKSFGNNKKAEGEKNLK